MNIKGMGLRFPISEFSFAGLSDIDSMLIESRLIEHKTQFIGLLVDVMSIIIRNQTEHISKKSRISRQLLKIGKEYLKCESACQHSLWLYVIYLQLVEVSSKNANLGLYLLHQLTYEILCSLRKTEENKSLSVEAAAMFSMISEVDDELRKYLAGFDVKDEHETHYLKKQSFLLAETLPLFAKECDVF